MALATALSGCTLPGMEGSSNAAATMVVETVSALQAAMSGTQTSQADQVQVLAPTPTVQPSATATFPPTRVPEEPVVNKTALCWTGPGSAYPVVSGIKAGTVVKMLGVSSKEGWFVIENPIYRDRCWIQAINVKLDPNFTTVGMKIYNPPPTPGPKKTPVPTATP
jgi:hypothetical protein